MKCSELTFVLLLLIMYLFYHNSGGYMIADPSVGISQRGRNTKLEFQALAKILMGAFAKERHPVCLSYGYCCSFFSTIYLQLLAETIRNVVPSRPAAERARRAAQRAGRAAQSRQAAQRAQSHRAAQRAQCRRAAQRVPSCRAGQGATFSVESTQD